MSQAEYSTVLHIDWKQVSFNDSIVSFTPSHTIPYHTTVRYDTDSTMTTEFLQYKLHSSSINQSHITQTLYHHHDNPIQHIITCSDDQTVKLFNFRDKNLTYYCSLNQPVIACQLIHQQHYTPSSSSTSSSISISLCIVTTHC